MQYVFNFIASMTLYGARGAVGLSFAILNVLYQWTLASAATGTVEESVRVSQERWGRNLLPPKLEFGMTFEKHFRCSLWFHQVTWSMVDWVYRLIRQTLELEYLRR